MQYICSNAWISAAQPTCMYHVKFCVRKDHFTNEKLKVVLPNKHGLCERHHVARFHQLPSELRAGVPGVMEQSGYRMSEVARVTNGLKDAPQLDTRTEIAIDIRGDDGGGTVGTGTGGKHAQEKRQQQLGQINRRRKNKSRIRKKKRKKKKGKRVLPVCSWNDTNDQGWRYQCTNLCTTQKQTGAVLPLCAYHIQTCRIDNPWISNCKS